MRRLLALLALGLTALVILWSCSKKSGGPPTAPTPEPACSLSTTALSFGTVTTGSSADRAFTLTNSGGGTLSGTVTKAGSEFSLLGATGYSLGAGQSQGFTVRFSPTTSGAKACTLTVGSCGKVIASGTAQTATPTCNVPVTLLDLGAVNYGQQTYQPFSVQNTGGGTLSGSISGASGDFSIDQTPSFSLGAGQSANFTLRFIPSSGGAQACTLQVSPAGCAQIVCRGTGNLPISGDCGVRVTSGTLDFGSVSIGSSADLPFTLKNFDPTYNGNGAVTEICPDFEALGTAFDLGPGGQYTMYARFTPTQPGRQSCAMPVSCVMEGAATNGGIESYVVCTGVQRLHRGAEGIAGPRWRDVCGSHRSFVGSCPSTEWFHEVVHGWATSFSSIPSLGRLLASMSPSFTVCLAF